MVFKVGDILKLQDSKNPIGYICTKILITGVNDNYSINIIEYAKGYGVEHTPSNGWWASNETLQRGFELDLDAMYRTEIEQDIKETFNG